MTAPIRIHRRASAWLPVVLLPALIALLGLSACERQDTVAEAFPEPVVAGSTCAADGMLLMNHPGPKGQIVYTDGTRAFYCDVREVFEALHDPEQAHRVAKAFVQPMDGRAWDAHADGWADAQTLVYVLGSGRMGHMGPTMIPFRQREAAHALMAEQGGRLVAAGELTAEAVAAYARETREALRGMKMQAGPTHGGMDDSTAAPHGMPGMAGDRPTAPTTH